MGNDGPDYSNVAAGGQVNVTHPLHVEQHEDGGVDELNVGGLSGELADNQPPSSHTLGGGRHTVSTLESINLKVSNATLDDEDDPRDPKAHKTSHQNEGTDEIGVAGLSGELADDQSAKAHILGGGRHTASTLELINLKVSDATLDDEDATRTPKAHKTSHQNEGTDEISVVGLSGELADDQPTKAHKVSHENGGSDEISLEGLSGVPAELSVIAAIYETNAGQSIPHNTWTIVDYEDKVQDTHDAVTIGAAWKFTAPADGYYAVQSRILYQSTDTWAEGEIAALNLHVNGDLVVYVMRDDNHGSGVQSYFQAFGSAIVYLNTGDYLDIRAIQISGGTLTLLTEKELNRISIVKFAGS